MGEKVSKRASVETPSGERGYEREREERKEDVL